MSNRHIVSCQLSQVLNPFPNDKLQTLQNKAFADDNFKFDDNGRKFSRKIENSVGKGEIAQNEQFLLFPQCFQKTCTRKTRENQGLFGKGLILFPDIS